MNERALIVKTLAIRFLFPSTVLLLPVVLTFWFRAAALRRSGTEGKIVWSGYREFGRVILAVTVACWWVMWDLGGRSTIAPILVRNWPGLLETSNAEALIFWVPPIVSLGIFLVLCYTVDRNLLYLRWTTTDMLRRGCWKLVSFVVPLQMVAAGSEAIFERRVWGVTWFLGAGVVARVGTGFSLRAEGLKFNTLKSGELRNRAIKMASRMGVALGRVYMVPAGKSHLTNAYGMSNSIGLTDSLGKYLNKPQMDYIIAHELAHVRLKHGRKRHLMTIALFSTLILLLFAIPQHALLFRPLLQVLIILGPLVVMYYFSRRFEYSADREAIEFVGDPENAIRALASLHKISEVPARSDRITGLFMTHPPLAQRVSAIATNWQIPSERMTHILEDAGIPEVTAQLG